MFATIKNDLGLRATLLGSFANVLLVAAKFFGGIFGGSSALIADAFHSLADLLNDGIVIFTYRLGKKPQDAGHPYGHGRAETLGSACIGIAILILGVKIAKDMWDVLMYSAPRAPLWITAVIAFASIVIKESLYRYTRRVGENLSSPSIVANAWDQRSDAMSSVATFLGIVGALCGFPLLDPLAGAVVALMILRTGVAVLVSAVQDLMDASLETQLLVKIENSIRATRGVLQSHDLRTRRIGGQILIDVHILVNPEILVTEGHKIAESVRRRLIKDIANVLDVMVHVDPENDADMERLYTVNREDLAHHINTILAEFPEIAPRATTRMHYLRGKTIVEIVLGVKPGVSPDRAKSVAEQVKKRVHEASPLDGVRVHLDFNSDPLY
jgi:cation diffusion facilitator family transporter